MVQKYVKFVLLDGDMLCLKLAMISTIQPISTCPSIGSASDFHEPNSIFIDTFILGSDLLKGFDGTVLELGIKDLSCILKDGL